MDVYDIESDGLKDSITKVHCINLIDRLTGEEMRFTDHEFYQDLAGEYTDVPCPRTGDLKAGMERLCQAECTAGHNIIDYDEQAIEIVYPDFKLPYEQKRFDSRVASKLLYPDLKDRDFAAVRKGKLELTTKESPDGHGIFAGSHSLGAWGKRLDGDAKSDFKPGNYINPHTGEPHTWKTMPFTQDMDEYCMQDVRANVRLIEHFEKRIEERCTWEAVWDEMEVQRIISWQESVGVPFDREAGEALARVLYERLYELREECKHAFPAFYVRNGKTKTAKKTIRYKDKLRADLTEGAEYQPIKLVEFNPGSRAHISLNLKRKYGWSPTEFTDTGQAKIDEEILGALPYPEAKQISEFLMVKKRLSQLAEGEQAWLKKEKNGYIYGRVDALGARTRRMTHSKPNLAQVPSNDAPYGHECRAMFTAEVDRDLVGCDADALELRILAHFMALYDGGEYIKVVLDGNKEDGTDIHSRNQRAIGLKIRGTAKTWFYAFIYGAGDPKLGSIVMSEWSVEKLGRFYAKFPAGKVRDKKIRMIGYRSRKQFMANLPALAKLVEKVQEAAKRGWLKGLDGSRIPCPSAHSALNTLCQSAGALVMKKALIFMFREYHARSLDVRPLLNVHDEVQLSTQPEESKVVGTIAADSIRLAGEHYKFRCPLAGNYDIGKNWSETH